jgi:hypothetical protein
LNRGGLIGRLAPTAITAVCTMLVLLLATAIAGPAVAQSEDSEEIEASARDLAEPRPRNLELPEVGEPEAIAPEASQGAEKAEADDVLPAPESAEQSEAPGSEGSSPAPGAQDGVLAPASPDSQQEGLEEKFDPWEGIDRNGRIPRARIPDDIEVPERWRYIPEGRIKPGNFFQRLLVSSFIVPFIFNNGDVGTGFGLGFTDIDFRKQRRREFAGLFISYTTKGQQRYGFSWRRSLKARELPEGGVLIEERSWVRAHFEYRKTLTRRFFGRGPNRKAFQESSYTDEVFDFGFGGAWSLSGALNPAVIQLGLAGQFHQLDDGTVQGVASTRFAYPIDFGLAQTSNLGIIGGELRWDTRDSQRNPYRGYVVGVRFDAAPIQTDWDTGAVFKLFGSKVFAVPGIFHSGGDPDEAHPPTDTLAFAFVSQATAGELPFFLLPTLGGSKTLRGYIDGRWRDRAAWFAGVEYRFWVIPRGIPLTRNIRIERLGLAAFYEIGATTPDIAAFFDSKAAMSYGFGLRVGLERAALFRLDFGFAPGSFNFSAGFGLTF